jgi:hypothetical protein
MLRGHGVQAVELSALRFAELAPLMEALPGLDLAPFDFVSIHAPSRFAEDEEQNVIDLLHKPAKEGLPIVVHPDVMFQPIRWAVLGTNLLIENMDKRKPIGRTVRELGKFFDALPSARFCFDVGHARQVDPTMTEAALLLNHFGNRLAEVHMSEVNTASHHDPLSFSAVSAFSSVLQSIPESVPVILESLIDQGQSDIETELRRAVEVFSGVAV